MVQSGNTTYNDTYHKNIRETVTKVLANYETYENALKVIDGADQIDTKEPEKHEGRNVIVCKPAPYMILRHGEDENFTQDVIDKDDVFLSISYVECEYIWSKPTAVTNAALTPKFLNKYTAPTNNAVGSNETESLPIVSGSGTSAAAMLKKREE